MTFFLIVVSMAVFCLPIIGIGLQMVRKGPTTSAKWAGLALLIMGGLPLMLSIVIWLWLDFFSN